MYNLTREKLLIGLVLLVGGAGVAAAEEMDHSQHAGHDTAAATHTQHGHGAGGWMLGYSFMRMNMDGLLDGSTEVSAAEVTAMTGSYGYIMAPTTMTMDMHMIMGMYGITNSMTVMVMGGYLSKEMDMQARDGTKSTMSASGLGDTSLGLMYKATPNLTVGAGLSVPTGDIDATGDMAMSSTMTMTDVKLPYGMQLGSGTWDLTPSITWANQWGPWGGGVQASYTWHSGENANKYTVGDRFELSLNGKYYMMPNFVGTGRLAHANWDNISGADPEIAQTMDLGMMGIVSTSPAADPKATGGSRTDFLFGVNGRFGNHMLGIEIGIPLAQDLDGPQLKTDSVISLGYQFMMM